jgi:hypothetical protein
LDIGARIAAAIFDADLKQNPTGRLDSEQHRGLARAQLDRAAPVLPGTAFSHPRCARSTRAWRRVF